MSTESSLITQPMCVATRPPWIEFALAKIGEREISGDKDNPFIVKCLHDAGLRGSYLHDETAWCGAFAGQCMLASGIQPPKGFAGARNWIGFGTQLAAPIEGCVGVYWRGTPNATTGHVGFPMGVRAGADLVLGGNEQNAVSHLPYAKARNLGYWWPPGVALPANAQVKT